MILNQLYKFFIALLIVIANFPALACAVCYTDNGMSGASIALLVIVSSFLISRIEILSNNSPTETSTRILFIKFYTMLS